MALLASSPWMAWSAPPLVLAGSAAALGLFVQGWLRLRRRGRADLASRGRLALFLAAIAIITLAIVSPIDAVGEDYLQSAHMLQHVLIADLGVVLAVLALRGPLAFFFLPRDLLAPLARVRPLRRLVAWLRRPRTSVALWLGVLVVWHVPFFYELALRTRAFHDLQHLSFILAGTLLWVLLIDPTGHGGLTVAGRVGIAVLVFIAGQLLAYVLAFSYRPFYGVYEDQEERLLGLSPLTDQKIAAVVMMVEQALTIGVFILWQLRRRALSTEARA